MRGVPLCSAALFGSFFFFAKGGLKVVQVVVQGGDCGFVGPLLTLHGSDDDVVAELKLLEIDFVIGGRLQALREEVVEHGVLE